MLRRLVDAHFRFAKHDDAQLILGFVVLYGSIVWTLAAFLLTSEAPNILLMSGAALVLTGLSIIAAASALRAARNRGD